MPAGLSPACDNTGMNGLAWDVLATPVGDVWLACSARGVAQVGIGGPPEEFSGTHRAEGGEATDSEGHAQAMLARVRAEVREYFSGDRRVFGVPVDWSGITGMRREVLSLLHASVGYGETITYRGLAERTGLFEAGHVAPARVAGQIVASNPCPLIVPCHRVVAGNGLGGYSAGAGVETKRWLLAFEGAIPATLDFAARP